MDNVDVYNNDHGWRISFPIGNGIQVLTLDETKELKEALESAIIYAESASQQADSADKLQSRSNADYCPMCDSFNCICTGC